MNNNLIKEAEITIRNVDFGDSIYVKVIRECGTEATYLIDTGYLKYAHNLKSSSIKTIDTLILTHKHSDHIGAVSYIIDESFELKNIFLAFKDVAFASKTNVRISKRLKKIYDEGKWINIFDVNDKDATEELLDFQVLYPMEGMESHADDINRDSIVLLLCVGKYGVLFTGDVTVKEEEIIIQELEKHKITEVYMLKIAHHGSANSTSNEFLYQLPLLKYALVSSSITNKYHLPSEKFKERWRNFSNNHDCKLFCTGDQHADDEGNLSFKINKNAGVEEK